MTDKNKKEAPSKEPVNDADKTLDEAKGKFSHLIVVGIDQNNQLDVVSTVHQYPFLQWLLGKAQMELFLHEKQANKPSTIEE